MVWHDDEGVELVVTFLPVVLKRSNRSWQLASVWKSLLLSWVWVEMKKVPWLVSL